MTEARLRQVAKQYAGHRALDGVDLDLSGGEIVGLVGPNGAGKTTLLRIAAGLVRPTSGEVNWAPRPEPGSIRYFGGEHTMPPGSSAREWLQLLAPGFRDAAPRGRLGILSRGTRQRIGLCAVLASNVESLLLLDEPWEGLDPDASRWLSDELARKRADGWAILVSSHRMHDLAGVCDRCEFLVSGRIAAPAFEVDADLDSDARVAGLFRAFDRSLR